MFTLRPESVKTFVNDQTIRLPRFQRKQTWKDRKNFNLCISVYKDFPMGVVVIKVDSNQGPKRELVKWLLDGRQRQNVLKGMKNPEKIYAWAKKSIPVSRNDDVTTLEKNFWDYIERYLEDEESEIVNGSEEIDNMIGLGQIDEDSNADCEEDNKTDSVLSSVDEPESPSYSGLKDLCDLIETVHPLTKRSSGFTSPFNYCKYLPNLPYVKMDQESGTNYVDSDALIAWIESRRAYDSLNGKQFPPTKDMFVSWLVDSHLSEDVIKNVKKQVDKNWNKISKILYQLDSLDKKLQEAKIGYLELNADCTDADAKKIFEIINSEGTPLTAAEILSAKPSWNKNVTDAHSNLKQNKEKLYMQMEIKGEGIVRWDVAASFTDGLDNTLDFILGDWRNVSADRLEKKITLGFKLMSGYYLEAISRDEISRLSNDSYLKEKNVQINWGSIEIQEKLNRMGKILHQNNFFKYWSSWGVSMMETLSDAVAINFLLITFKDWMNKGEPMNSQSSEYRIFQKNAVILFDKLLFEYVMKKWRGSSDSVIAKNLKELKSKMIVGSNNYAFEAIKNQEWANLIAEMIGPGTINGMSYTSEKLDTRLRGLLYYYYVLKQRSGPNDPTISGIEVDHIIPQSSFEGESNAVKEMMNNIVNLALLPKRQNISKGSKRLIEIEDPWLRDQISVYEEISESQYKDLSEATMVERLKEYRGKMILDAFEKHRNYWLIQ